MNTVSGFTRYVRALLIYTLVVIVWGAWVRISRSGDGCGDSWPLCKGALIPELTEYATYVELSHRLTSGIYGFLVIGLVFWARKKYPKGHELLKLSYLTLFFTVTEALIGAGLVLKGLVGDNESMARAWVMCLHMFNSLLLTGSLAILLDRSREVRTAGSWSVLWRASSGCTLAGFVLIACTGAFAALASTLYPAESLIQGLQDDLALDSPLLLKLRILHPFAAVSVGGLMLWLSYKVQFKTGAPDFLVERGLKAMRLIFVAIAFGFVTLFSLSPTWMKLMHLLLAHTLWIYMLWLTYPILLSEDHGVLRRKLHRF